MRPPEEEMEDRTFWERRKL